MTFFFQFYSDEIYLPTSVNKACMGIHHHILCNAF